ncbi:MAG: amidohydrolase family protein [Flavobacteriales bacterium]|nr:amidohydrolase family protein [Flavobacteriales bacterium]
MRDPQLKEKILTENSDKVAGDGTPVPPLTDRFLKIVDRISFKLFELGQNPDYEQPREKSLGAQAKAAGMDPLSFVYDTLLKDNGRALIYFPIYNYTEFNYDNVYTMMNHPQSIQGLSDSGAHVGTVCDGSFSTYLISHWTRDRNHKIALERAIQMITQETAEHMGFSDRGSLEVGKKADLNVIDYENLSLRPPRMIRDLPAGGVRLMQDVTGYLATVVSGKTVIENDRITSERPGKVVRSCNMQK